MSRYQIDEVLIPNESDDYYQFCRYISLKHEWPWRVSKCGHLARQSNEETIMESKNQRGELLGNRSLQQKENDEKFKNIALQQIKDSGENWAIHSLAI